MPSASAAASTMGLNDGARLAGGPAVARLSLAWGSGAEEVAAPDHGLDVARARVDRRRPRPTGSRAGSASTLATASSADDLAARVERGVDAQPAAEDTGHAGRRRVAGAVHGVAQELALHLLDEVRGGVALGRPSARRRRAAPPWRASPRRASSRSSATILSSTSSRRRWAASGARRGRRWSGARITPARKAAWARSSWSTGMLK